MDVWDKRLNPNYVAVVQNLQPLSLVDLLLERGLLQTEEYSYIRSPQHMTEEDRSRALLERLRRKGPQSFDSFCEVLLAVPGQAFIATDVLGYSRGVARKEVTKMESTEDDRHSVGEGSDSPQGMKKEESPPRPESFLPHVWERGRLIGQGGFGKVYECLDKSSGRLMAVKQVEMSTSGPVTKEFEALEREIRMLSEFAHERIVKYYGSEKKEQSFSIFMEYMPGGSLWDDLKRQGPFHEPLVRKYTGQILEGLQYLHSNRIIHRDIKGQNILLSSSHDVKLVDFGTAKSIEGIQTVTGFTAQVGTCNCMSPEMIKGEKYGRKTDIWSLGCTVIEMFTADVPWPGLTRVTIILQVASGNIPELPEHASESAKTFMRLSLKPDPSKRPWTQSLLNHEFITGSHRFFPESELDQEKIEATTPPLPLGPLKRTKIDYNRHCMISQLDAVAKAVNDKWYELGFYLGFDVADLREYEKMVKGNLYRRTLEMLSDWMKREDNPTVMALVSACREAGVGAEAQRVLEGI